uniref:Uncharacterized protein n=1 Tax=Graphocephala atropunctata TaxID=36148 RepID=A0A1B6MRS8_9HEMI
MRLTSILFRGFKIPGARFKGKVRMVKRVTPIALNDLRNDFKIEEKNMLYLRYPFLTLEQSKALTKELKNQEVKQIVKKVTAIDEKFSAKSTRIVDQLKHLRITEDWDVIK